MEIEFKIAGAEQGFGVPYPEGADPGSTNVGYIDLKKNLDQVTEFPEVRGWPELETFIRAVMQPPSLFRTLRCDIAASPFKRFGCTRKVSSYVTVAYEILDWNLAPEHFRGLCESFRQYAAGVKAPVKLLIEFELIPTSYRDHGVARAWSVDLWVSGLGTSKEAARATWRAGLRILQDFLTQQSALYADRLNQGHATLS